MWLIFLENYYQFVITLNVCLVTHVSTISRKNQMTPGLVVE